MTQSVAILGRQPALGLAELESLYGASAVRPLGTYAAQVAADPSTVSFSRLGGTVKLAAPLTIFETTNWLEIAARLKDALHAYVGFLPSGKLHFGLSTYGLSATVNQLNTTGLELKKLIKLSGRSVRFVPNKELALNSAQVLYNQLLGDTGMELVLVRDQQRTVVCRTIAEQDIDAYAARDQARPKRDAKVGMLPPKLAQIIINLAVDESTVDSRQLTVLDPFCGTGVMLQEALLMNYTGYGSDLEPRMVEYSETNLQWLFKTPAWKLEIADATNHRWSTFDTIAAETYLGRPFSALPRPEVLAEVMQDVDTIHKKFLRNVSRQTKPGFRMCIAVPAWKTKSGFKHLKTLDSLDDLGYTRAVFTHVENKDLVYHRPEQIVARELAVLIRK